jgi:hypothetical protein
MVSCAASAYKKRMATAKKKPAAKKSTSSKAKAAKPAPKKTTTKSKKDTVSTADTKIPAGREHKLAEQALKLVDQAASVLREGIRTGASTTAKSRIAAKKKANSLLDKASSNLSKAIHHGSDSLQKLIGKI